MSFLAENSKDCELISLSVTVGQNETCTKILLNCQLSLVLCVKFVYTNMSHLNILVAGGCVCTSVFAKVPPRSPQAPGSSAAKKEKLKKQNKTKK